MISGPSADPSCPGETDWFWPGPTQELAASPRPPFCNLSNNPPNPPSRPPAPSPDVGCAPALVPDPAPLPPPNKAPEASKPVRASSSGLPILPPGTAEWNISSRPAIVLLRCVSVEVDHRRVKRDADPLPRCRL